MELTFRGQFFFAPTLSQECEVESARSTNAAFNEKRNKSKGPLVRVAIWLI